MLKNDRRHTIGRKAIKDLLHIAKQMGVTDAQWAEASGLPRSTFKYWRWRVEQGTPMYPQLPTVEMALNGLQMTMMAWTKRNF